MVYRMFTGLLMLLMVAGSGRAQTPSSKATAAISTAVGCKFSGQTTIADILPVNCHDIFSGAAVEVSGNFATIMKTTIKVSNSQSIFASPSLVTGLYTQTKTRVSPGQTSQAVGEGAVYLRVIARNQASGIVQIAYPVAACKGDVLGCALVGSAYGVELDSRVQTLTQSLSDCVVNVVVGGVPGTGTCNFTATTDLVLKTTSAHTYNFIFPQIGQGTYDISVQAAVSANSTVQGLGTAGGGAAFGLGSMTVESVRLVHDFTF